MTYLLDTCALSEFTKPKPSASVDAWFQLGSACFNQGKYQKAAESLQKAIELKPNFALAHFDLGQCRKQLGDRQGAIAAESRRSSRPVLVEDGATERLVAGAAAMDFRR